jgi:hypothetical protein
MRIPKEPWDVANTGTLCLCLSLPQVLVYGEALDLSPFMAEQAMDEGPATYTLSGVIVHLDQVGAVASCMGRASQ